MNYYARKDVQEELLRISKNREVQIWINDIRGKRPEIINFLGDVNSLVRDGMTSLHISVERWKDPLRLKSGMSKKDLDDLRLGFDLLLDLDSKYLEYSRITAELLMEALKFHDVKDVSIKFSVTGDTPILIKSDNYTKLVPISEAIKLYKSDKKLKVLSLDKGAYLNFLDVSGSLSHLDKVYNIYHEQSGLPIKATGYHSVFCWDKGDIIQKKVSELKIGDNLVSFISSNKIKYNKKNITNKFTYSGTDKKISINVTKDLMRLIGYYLAEGHATKINSMVGFSFNKNEKMYINDVKNIIKALPGFNSTIRDAYPNKGSHQIIINSKEWFSFFNDFCGVRDNKHIPDFVWDLPTNYFLELLLGYIRGDAHKRSPRYLTIKSVSHKLTTELIWLCKMHGISCNLYEEYNKPHTLPQGTWFKGSHVFMIKILKSDFPLLEHNTKRNKLTAYPASRTYPIDGLKEVYHIIKPGKFLSHRNEQMTLSKKRANINRILKVIRWFESDHYLPINSHCKNIIQKYKDLEKQDICVLEVRKIIKKQKKEKVYDISVKDTERFFGGYYPILLHNSGNHGFHIAIPYESFPDTLKGQKLNLLYPDIIRIIASYLKEMIRPHLTERLLKLDSIEEIAKKSGKTKAEIIKDEQFDPFTVVDIDTILISSRHMFRAPFSLNEKSGLISIPLKDIKNFNIEDAKPENVKTDVKFLDYDNVIKGSANQLLLQAYDWSMKKETIKVEDKRLMNIPTKEIKEDFFPPCISSIMKGLPQDGRKRSVFILLNFLNNMNWSVDKIEAFLLEWNKKNYEPLKEGYIKAQILWFKKQNTKILPANCNNPAYYKTMGICNPDNLCAKIKNPINYSIRKLNFVKNKSKSL